MTSAIKLLIRPLEGSGREAERRAVASLVSEALGSELSHHADGAPFAADCPERALSVSHGAGFAVVAIAPAGSSLKIGVDVESTTRPGQLERVRSRFVGPADSPALSLLHLWTAKEAVYKAARQPGLPLTAIAVTVETCPGTSGTSSAGTAIAAGHTYSLRWHQISPAALLCLAAL